MKNLNKLTKELGFTHKTEFFDYLIESHINGNFSQCKELFSEMIPQDREVFIDYLGGQVHHNGIHNSIRVFYIDFNENTLKRYKVYKIGRKHGMGGRRKVLGKNLTREQAKRLVNSYPNSSRSMVLFCAQ